MCISQIINWLPRWLVAQLVKNLPSKRDTWVQFLVWEDAQVKGKSTHSSILAWRIPWTVHGVAKSWIWLFSEATFTSLHFFSGGSVVKNPSAVQEFQKTPAWSLCLRSPGEGNGNTLQCSCPYNPKDRVARIATVHGVAKVKNDWAKKYSHTHHLCRAYFFW